MMRNKRSAQARHELLMFAAEVLGNHYKKQAMSDNDRLEANLKREVSAFKSSQHKSNSRLGMSNRTVA